MTWFRRKVNKVVIRTRQQTWVIERNGKPIPDEDVKGFKEVARLAKAGKRGELDINFNLNDRGQVDPQFGDRKISLRYEDVISVDFE